MAKNERGQCYLSCISLGRASIPGVSNKAQDGPFTSHTDPGLESPRGGRALKMHRRISPLEAETANLKTTIGQFATQSMGFVMAAQTKTIFV